MSRGPLLKLLKNYASRCPDEAITTDTFTQFVRDHEQCFSRETLKGHVTGSAWIVDQTKGKCLLIHHRKLQRWLQPGGHADGCPDIEYVARKEAEEETGLKQLQLWQPDIFDLDIHLIPERGMTPEHYHFDVRFIYQGSTKDTLSLSPETNDVAWWDLDEALHLVSENDSITRMIRKTKELL